MDREAIKGEIADLIAFFKTNYEQFKKQAESNTETKLIEKLFGILGWTTNDFEKTSHARREGRLGRPDYDFKINGKTVFFMEVKKVGISLEKEADAQAISYALSRRVPFAISTNFESLKIFCVEQENAINNVFRIFKKPEDYIENLQDLLFLHKESLEQNLLLRKAEDEGRLKKRISIDRPLLEDLMRIRNMIANDIEKRYPGKYDLNEREEIIQRIVDRLIFVRKCEDVGINPDELMLEEIVHNPYGKAHSRLKEIFKRYNEVYNGGLFAVGIDNDCDKIVIDGEIVQKLIHLLYESEDRQYVYNFDWIDADILGQVYEQYLGKILAQTRSGRSKLTNGQAHRKEQGIYYTPTYIVDYIVSNTLGSLLKDKRTDAKTIKILDPACGSGSFLIKAFDYLKARLYSDDESKMRRIDEQGMYSVKTAILKDNIYGVDLDSKAVEITKLNLLLKAAEKFRKLPEDVELHIAHGNSLIDDESVAGSNAFKWDGDFQEGSFDVVIGNPPYVRVQTTAGEDKNHLIKNYLSAKGKFDIYIVFIEKALRLLKAEGSFSFIIPNKFTQTKYGKELKQLVLENYTIQRFIDFGDLKVFGEVTTYPCILVIRKTRPNSRTTGTYVQVKKLSTDIEQRIMAHQEAKEYEDEFLRVFTFKQRDLGPDIWSFMPGATQDLFDKIEAGSSTKLKDLTEKCVQGFITGNNGIFILRGTNANDLEETIMRRMPKGKYVGRYTIADKGYFAIYPHEKDGAAFSEKKLSDEFPRAYSYLKAHEGELRKRRYYNKSIMELYGNWWGLVHPIASEYFEQTKIVTPNLSKHNHFALDVENRYIEHDCYLIILKNKDINYYKYLLGLLNSKVIEFFIRQKSPMFSGGYYKYHTQYLEQIPIREAESETRRKLIELVDRMLSLNKRLNEIGDKKTGESAKIEEEIRKTDAQIDRLVYAMYALTEGEIRIVEDSLTPPPPET
jgi:type I restriction-modification system DNA methylase subunit